MNQSLALLVLAATSALSCASKPTPAAVTSTAVTYVTVSVSPVNSTVTLTEVLPTVTVAPSYWELKFCGWIEGDCVSEHIEMNACKAIPDYQTRGDMGSRMSVSFVSQYIPATISTMRKIHRG